MRRASAVPVPSVAVTAAMLAAVALGPSGCASAGRAGPAAEAAPAPATPQLLHFGVGPDSAVRLVRTAFALSALPEPEGAPRRGVLAVELPARTDDPLIRRRFLVTARVTADGRGGSLVAVQAFAAHEVRPVGRALRPAGRPDPRTGPSLADPGATPLGASPARWEPLGARSDVERAVAVRVDEVAEALRARGGEPVGGLVAARGTGPETKAGAP